MFRKLSEAPFLVSLALSRMPLRKALSGMITLSSFDLPDLHFEAEACLRLVCALLLGVKDDFKGEGREEGETLRAVKGRFHYRETKKKAGIIS